LINVLPFLDGVNIHWRDPETALDTTSSIVSVHEFLRHHPMVANLGLIQCTSPFVSPKYLQQAMKIFPKQHCVFAAMRSFKLRWKQNPNTHKVTPINFDFSKRPRRQDWDGE
jgi:CMP-N-acetylneuraminic acid synthetase